jgi:hypothetical protein
VAANYINTPPRQMRDSVARRLCDAFIAGTGAAEADRAAADD